MRKWIVQWAVLACAWGFLPGVQSEAFSWRFIGLNALRDKKDLVVLQQVTGLPEFEGFRSNLAMRVAATLAKPLAQSGGDEAEIARLLTPLAADLAAFPTIYEHQSNIWILAIQLPADRHEIWKGNWESISKAGKTDGAKIAREGNWTLLGNGSTKAILEKTKKAADDVLQMSGDASILGKLLPNLNPSKAELRVAIQGKGLRSEGKMQFEKDLPFKLTKWEIPMHTICEPLVGFTAIQGVQDYLSHQPAFKNQTAPNQLFIWSELSTPFSTYMAAKVQDNKTFALKLTENIDFKSMTNLNGSLEYDTNAHGLYLKGLPIFVPFVRPAHPDDAGFVQAGFIPMANFAKEGMPAELARELTSRTNLVYYDWELGFGRLPQYHPINQAIAIATDKPLPTLDAPASKWLQAAQTNLQNSVTEVTKTAPRELTLVRRSDVGMSALELFEFVQWIAGPPVAGKRGAGKFAVPALPPSPKNP